MNPNCTYILLDAIGIQRYIFETNTLRIITGSSLWLAQWQEECKKLCDNHGGELITSAGGNVLAKFTNADKAIKFKDSAINIRPAGLEIAWAEVDGNGKSDSKVWSELQVEIAKFKAGDRDKNEYIQPQKFIDKISCQFCGVRPSDGNEKIEKKDICEVCRQKYKKGNSLTESRSAQTPIESLNRKAGSFPQELDKMVEIPESKETELLAVVVIDLNEMGTRIENIVKDKGFKELHTFSEGLESDIAGICNGLIDDMIGKGDNWKNLNVKNKNGLCLRPLFLGGDDLVFAMPASLWQTFVSFIFDRLKGKNLEACAGIMIAKHNFPINQLVEMAEDLCANAKNLVKYRKQNNENISGFALDWHVHQESVFESPVSIRKRTLVKDLQNYTYAIATDKPYLYEEFVKIRNEVGNLSKISNRKLFSIYQGLRQTPQNTRDILVYEFLRNENEKMDKYTKIWEWVKQSGSQYPLWDIKKNMSVDNSTYTIFYSKYADILELKFQELETGGSDER